MRLLFILLLGLLAASCHRPPPTNPHYVLGQPYRANGAWYYPRERYEGHETGLATVYGPNHPELTANGEAFDQSVLAAAHQTLQLPAIARLSNLENGLQILVRINDRGPATPHRMLEVTRRVATLLRFPSNAAVRVRLEVLPAESRAAVDAVPGAPKLDIAAAPLGEVEQSDLPAPGSPTPLSNTTRPSQGSVESAAATIHPLPETLMQGAPEPGQLFIQLGTFQTYQYANMQRAQVASLGAAVVSTREGRRQSHRVIIGPIATVQQADIVLDQVIAAGVTDARIVVE